MSWKTETFGSLLTESRIPCENPDIEKRIRVKLNVQGVEKRPVGAEKEGATKQFIRKAGQFIYGKQNFHKGAFGVIPEELDGFETSADIPSFDVREDCLPEWIYYYFKAGNRYLELTEFARGVGSQRIHPKQLQDLEIPLPPIDVQRKIIAELKIIEKDEISTELTHQLDLVKQLRQAFLREAMQGKLVPQDPNDEPASVLLEKIKAEKERLIKKGKIKKSKPLPPISEDEVPFQIPANWVWCRLGNITSLLGDGLHGTPSYSKDGEYYFVNGNNLVDGQIVFKDNTKRVNEEEFEKHKKDLGTTTVLVSINGTLGNVAVYNGEKIILGKSACYFNLLNEINKWFIKRFVDSEYFLEYAVFVARQTTIKNVSLQSMRLMLIPLPPLSEQQRIVAKLDELMAYCDDLEASIKASQQQNDLLLQQVLREALEPKEKEVSQ